MMRMKCLLTSIVALALTGVNGLGRIVLLGRLSSVLHLLEVSQEEAVMVLSKSSLHVRHGP